MASSKLLNEKQVAERCSLTIRTLQRWRLESQGPPFRKCGRAVRYSEADLENWLRLRPTGGDRGSLVQPSAAA